MSKSAMPDFNMKLYVKSAVRLAFIRNPSSKGRKLLSNCIRDPEVLKLFQCSTQQSTKFILLINVKMPTIVGILTFSSMINTTSDIKQETSSLVGIFVL